MSDEDVPIDMPLSTGDNRLIEAMDRHYQRWLGPIANVFHEQVSPLIHLDRHLIPPAPDHPFLTICTTGMAEVPMTTPREFHRARFAELMIRLPADWADEVDGAKNPHRDWPIIILGVAARYPHYCGTWLGHGHTVSFEREDAVLPGTELDSLLVVQPLSRGVLVPPARVGWFKRVNVLQLVPITARERSLAMESGSTELINRLRRLSPDLVVDLNRPSVAD